MWIRSLTALPNQYIIGFKKKLPQGGDRIPLLLIWLLIIFFIIIIDAKATHVTSKNDARYVVKLHHDAPRVVFNVDMYDDLHLDARCVRRQFRDANKTQRASFWKINARCVVIASLRRTHVTSVRPHIPPDKDTVWLKWFIEKHNLHAYLNGWGWTLGQCRTSRGDGTDIEGWT